MTNRKEFELAHDNEFLPDIILYELWTMEHNMGLIAWEKVTLIELERPHQFWSYHPILRLLLPR